ncbi:MAG: methyltransferase [Planctomycetota bacterium]|nr:methyltransferase [Planctomycetota bacterium]
MSTEFLMVERYLHDALQARTLQAAFEMGVIDLVAESGAISKKQLFRNRSCDSAGADFLTRVLAKAGIFQLDESSINLTAEFREALKYRDLLLTKLQFSELVAVDFFTRMPQLLSSSEEFMATSKLFELFDYSRCYEITPENCLQASRWMKLTTMLTRYEAPVCCEHFAFAEHQRMLDIGGNSGEFAVQVCRRAPSLEVTIADLPVVCHVGERHVAAFEEASRIRFQPLHFINDALPTGHDLITCKSVLHDWPDDLTEVLIRKCFQTLPASGRLLIFERQQWDIDDYAMGYGLLPVLLFFRSYRRPEFYTSLLNAVGFSDVNIKIIPLEVPFMLITAVASGKR